MASPKVPTAEQLVRLRAAFAAHRPARAADFAHAAANARVTVGQARRAWLHGWPSASITPLERELGDAAAAKRELGAAVTTAEMVADACVRRAHELGEHVDELLPVAKRLVAALKDAPDLEHTAPAFALSSLSRIAHVLERQNRLAADAVELQRLTSDQATSIVGHVDVSPDEQPLDVEAARAELAAAQRALDFVARERAMREQPAEPEPEASEDPRGPTSGAVN